MPIRGLFAGQPFAAGMLIACARGKLIDAERAPKGRECYHIRRPTKGGNGRYLVLARATATECAILANSAAGGGAGGKKSYNNARLHYPGKGCELHLKAKRNIPNGHEILCAYGRSYDWGSVAEAKKEHAAAKAPAVPAADRFRMITCPDCTKPVRQWALLQHRRGHQLNNGS